MLAGLITLGVTARECAAQLVWLPNCPGQGVVEVAARMQFGPPAAPGSWVPSWVMWTPAHRQPSPVPGQYLRAVCRLPIWIAPLPPDPRLFLRGPYDRRILGTVTHAMPALCALPIRR